MILTILNFVLRRGLLTPIAMAILVAALGVQSARLGRLKTELASARAAAIDAATGRAWRAEALARAQEASRCSASLDEQTHALDSLARQAREATARAQARLDAARAASRSAASRAQSVLAARARGDGCREADALILSSLGGSL